jgi:hypothetical protein
MLIDREVFTSVGGFDEDYFAYFEDVDLGWRLWLMGHEVIFAPAAVAYHKRFSTAGKYLGIKHLFLCERNALYTIYKNYSEEHLRAVLPAALILLVQRALLHTAGASVGLPESSVSNRTEPGKPEVATHEGGFSRILRMLREAGFRATLERARLASVLRRMRKDGIYPISQEGLSILSAIPSLTANLKKLSSKREFVQGHRKRSDAEIFSLFGEPFRPLPDNREFEELVATLSETFGLDSIFDAERTAGT